MTAVGTPLFAAPEICRGEEYDENVDVYSFGMLLLAMSTADDIALFVGERWGAHFKRKKIPNPSSLGFNRVLSPVWEEGWRPVTQENPVSGAPPTIVALIVRCCDHDPAQRPSFQEIQRELSGTVAAEVGGPENGGGFIRILSPSSKIVGGSVDPGESTGAYPEEMRRASEARLASRLSAADGGAARENPMRASSHGNTDNVAVSDQSSFL